MIFTKPYNSLIIIAILALITAVALLFGILSCTTANTYEKEGFQTAPLTIDPTTNKIVNGYYQVDNTTMAVLPYGFAVDPNNPMQIVPVTEYAKLSLMVSEYPPVPSPGDKMPDQFYLIADSSLAVLPPNMSPNLTKIDFSGNPTKILYYYSPGYISQTMFYEKTYKPDHYPSSLPDGVYYVDPSHTLISFLQYGQIANDVNGYGAIQDPNLNLSTTQFNYLTSNYRNVVDNYDAKFHDDIETLIKQDDSDGIVRVKDQAGNIVILPKLQGQDSVTYYQPGEFPFGAANYVPNYEDSVYLSTIGYRTRFGNEQPSSSNNSCGSICDAYNDFRTKMDTTCGYAYASKLSA